MSGRSLLKQSVAWIALLLVASTLVVAMSCMNGGGTTPPSAAGGPGVAAATGPDRIEATLAGRTFLLDTALNDAERFEGLSGVAELPPDGGMIFAFRDADVRTFVMRDCLIPLDIVFLDPGGRVIRTAHMPLEPGVAERNLTRHGSRYPAQFVIELPGGTLGSLDLSPGDAVGLPLRELNAAAE